MARARGGARRTASTSSPSSRPTTCTRRIASAFLDAGIDVICDKPMTHDARRGARRSSPRCATRGRLFALTHNYTGYPMVRQAREMVAAGELGEHPRGPGRIPAGLAEHRSGSDRPEAGRVARRSGAAPAPAAALGDIGTHAEHLARFISGLELAQVSADLTDLRRRAAGSTTTAMCCCATRTARAACSGRARSRPATRTRCACASTAARPGSRSRRSIPTSSGSRRWASRRS